MKTSKLFDYHMHGKCLSCKSLCQSCEKDPTIHMPEQLSHWENTAIFFMGKEGREGNIIMFDLPSGIVCPRYGPPKKLPNEIFLSVCVCAACSVMSNSL